MSKVQIELPPKLIPVFSAQNVRYRSSWGGRGSGKTRTFALMTAIKGYMYAEAGVSGLILGAREFMNTLSESSMEEIKLEIDPVAYKKESRNLKATICLLIFASLYFFLASNSMINYFSTNFYISQSIVGIVYILLTLVIVGLIFFIVTLHLTLVDLKRLVK